MRREELALVILGELDESFIDEAMPKKAAFSAGNDTAGVQRPEMIKEVAEVSKRDIRIYWITRALGMAAVVALIVGAAVLLVQNWDKIAVSGNERLGVVTSVTNGTVTPDTIGPDTTDRFEQITDTSMPEPYDSMEYPLGNFDFYSLWQAKLFGADQIVHFDYEKKNEYRKRVEGIETPYGYTADEYRRCLVDMSENSVTIALPYVHDNRDTNQTSVYYELTFIKDESGEWSVEYQKVDIKVYSPI